MPVSPPTGCHRSKALAIFPVAFGTWFEISLWVAALSALLMAAIWARARPWSPPALAWQVAGLALLWASFRWNPEDIAYLLLALSFARIDRPRVSAVAMAAAICSNPLSWITVPVYLAILAREPGFCTRVVWLSGGVLIGVLPWLIWDHALLGELWRFIALPLFPFGASLATLVPPPNHFHWLFTLGLLVGMASCALVAWRWPLLALVDGGGCLRLLRAELASPVVLRIADPLAQSRGGPGRVPARAQGRRQGLRA